MSTEVLTPHASAPPEKSPFLPIEVLVIVLGESVVVYPSNLRIPWGYEGTIVWNLASNDSRLEFAKPGVVFLNDDAPFGQPTNDKPGQCQLSVTNIDTNSGKTGTQFHYNLQFVVTGSPSSKILKFDPTVENDPPTP
jgi:hypothetical protein